MGSRCWADGVGDSEEEGEEEEDLRAMHCGFWAPLSKRIRITRYNYDLGKGDEILAQIARCRILHAGCIK